MFRSMRIVPYRQTILKLIPFDSHVLLELSSRDQRPVQYQPPCPLGVSRTTSALIQHRPRSPTSLGAQAGRVLKKRCHRLAGPPAEDARSSLSRDVSSRAKLRPAEPRTSLWRQEPEPRDTAASRASASQPSASERSCGGRRAL